MFSALSWRLTVSLPVALSIASRLAAAVCPVTLPGNLPSYVYVSTRGTDGPSCGSSEVGACATPQQAVNRCGDTPNCAVVMRHGVYPLTSPLRLTTQIQVFGSCTFNGEPATRYRTILQGQAPVQVVTTNSTVQIFGVTVVSTPAPENQPSIGLLVQNTAVILDQAVVVSAPGGAGQRGQDGKNGNAANDGSSAGESLGGSGGPQVGCSDPGQTIAGSGGNGANYNGVDSSGGLSKTTCTPTTVSVAGKGQSSGTAIGGTAGQTGGSGCDCYGGVETGDTPSGFGGSDGAAGAASQTPGARSNDLIGHLSGYPDNSTWAPGRPGGIGGYGFPGAGGGGGGGGGFASVLGEDLRHHDFPGPPGGGGGSGGCGGLGGNGGGDGGASIAILSIESPFAEEGHNVLVPGPGGPGGMGGTGGSGVPGGSGGPGITGGQTYITGFNCQGYAPGNSQNGHSGGGGGAASGGAGGNGGPSFALISVENVQPTVPANTVGYQGIGGPGGAAGVNGGGNGTPASSPAGVTGAAGIVLAQSLTKTEDPSPHRPPKQR
jgi:hypothetical protein